MKTPAPSTPYIVPKDEAYRSTPLDGNCWYVHGRLGGKFVRILLDTGASSFYISKRLVKKLGLPIDSSNRVHIQTAGEGDHLRSFGTTLADLLLWDNKKQEFFNIGNLAFTVADLDDDVMLGIPLWEIFPECRIRTQEYRTYLTFKNKETTLDVVTQPTQRMWERHHTHAQPTTTRPSRSRFKDKSRIATITGKRFAKLFRTKKFECAFRIHIKKLEEDEINSWKGNPKLLRAVLEKYLDTLFKVHSELPPDRGDDNFRIDLIEGAQPVWQALRHMSDEELEEIRTQIADLLEKGWIQHSKSPWGASVVFAKKKDGGIRLCWDYRGLNNVTVKDRTPLPNIAEMRDRVHEAKVFTIVDIKDAYHRILVRPEDREKTAVRTRLGHFEFVVMPFGLTNAPATFQRLMNKILGPYYDQFVISYLDDILIYSKTIEEHRVHVDTVLGELEKHRLYVKPSKCEWALPEVEFCGHVIGKEGIRISPKKMETIKSWSRPRNTTEIRSFLGLANYFLEFVDGYADIALPLSELQSDKKPFEWTEAQEQAFIKLKKALVSAPVLMTFDPNKPVYVYTDSSAYAIGGWIGQPAKDGEEIPSPLPKLVREWQQVPKLRPICYFSRKMKPAEMAYPVHEQELLAIVKMLQHNRPYLVGRRFRLFTDHGSLIHLQTQPHLSRRQARWVEQLQNYDFEIQHIPGRWNHIADILSRNPTFAPRCADCNTRLQVKSILLGHQLNSTLNEEEYRSCLTDDPFWGEISSALEKPSAEQSAKERRFSIKNDKLYYEEDRLYVPPALRGGILRQFHDSMVEGGHLGRRHTMAKIMQYYYWPSLEKDVWSYIRTCPECRRYKPSRESFGLLRPLPIPQSRWHTVGFDIFYMPENGKYDACLCMVDYLTSRIVLAPTQRNVSAQGLAKLFIHHVWKYFGTPKVFVSDREPRALSDFFEAFTMMMKINHEFATARHQQTDGKCEINIKIVKSLMRPYLNLVGDNWVDLIPIVEFCWNSTPRPYLDNLSPFEVDLGRKIVAPGWEVPKELMPVMRAPDRHMLEDYEEGMTVIARIVQDKLRKSQDVMAQYYDRKRTPRSYQLGDDAELNVNGIEGATMGKKGAKLSPKWIGPFKITEFGPHPDTYKLQIEGTDLRGIWPYFHVNVLRPYISPNHPYRPDVVELGERPPPVEIRGREEWYVDRILDEEKRGRKKFVLVKWRGESVPTWEPVTNVQGTEAYDKWRKSQKAKSRRTADE